MTPFGKLMRYWRTQKNLTLRDQADFLDVSQAYLSALEHGKRGKPSFALVDQICVFLDLICHLDWLDDLAKFAGELPESSKALLEDRLAVMSLDEKEDEQGEIVTESRN